MAARVLGLIVTRNADGGLGHVRATGREQDEAAKHQSQAEGILEYVVEEGGIHARSLRDRPRRSRPAR